MRNGDFLPTRLQAQQDAVNIVCHSKTRSNPENNVGLITMAKWVCREAGMNLCLNLPILSCQFITYYGDKWYFFYISFIRKKKTIRVHFASFQPSIPICGKADFRCYVSLFTCCSIFKHLMLSNCWVENQSSNQQPCCSQKLTIN